MENEPPLLLVADSLVALLRQFKHTRRLTVQDAVLLLGPMEEAAAANIAGKIDAHDAVIQAVRGRYVPAIMEAHFRHGLELTRILDGIAQTIGAGTVANDDGKPCFKPYARCQPALADFMAGLLQESAREVVAQRKRLSRTAA